MSDIIDCKICGGCYLEDYCKCTCEEKEIRKLKKEIRKLKNDIQILNYGIMGDEEDLSEKDRKRLNEIYPN